MRTFYEEWEELDSNSPTAVGELQSTGNEAVTNSATAVAELNIAPSAIQLPYLWRFA